MKKIKSFLIVAAACFVNSVFSQAITFKYDENTQLYGFVDSNDNYVVNPIYKEFDLNFGCSGLYKIVDSRDKIGFISDKGNLIVQCKYDYVNRFESGFAIVCYTNGRDAYYYGLIDSTGKEVIPVKYGRLDYYPKDKVLVFAREPVSNLGLLNLEGEVVISAQYAFRSKNISKGLWPVSKNNKFGVIDLKNQVVIPFEYRMIENFSDILDIAAAQKVENGKYGFIDRAGKLVIPFEYDNAWISNKYIIAKKNNKWGILDRDNKIILPFEYFEIFLTLENEAWVVKTKREKMYRLDLNTKQKVVRN